MGGLAFSRARGSASFSGQEQVLVRWPSVNPSGKARFAMDFSPVTEFNGAKSLFAARLQMDFKVNDARGQ